MAENSSIEWCDHTFNPWEGCTKVSPGCAHCYAETRNHRFGNDNWGKRKPRRRTSASNWKQPLKWNEQPIVEVAERYHRARVFCASLSDWLDDEVPIEWLADLLALIHATPNLDWLLLTKRPENWRPRLTKAVEWLGSQQHEAFVFADCWLGAVLTPENVWIGTSVEDQKRSDERIPELLKIPANIRFLSCEPLLEHVDLDLVGLLNDAQDGSPMLQWVIVGGESGNPRIARPFHIEWARSIIHECREAGVACFVKQLGTNAFLFDDDVPLHHAKGGDCSEWPEDLRVRQFPVLQLQHDNR